MRQKTSPPECVGVTHCIKVPDSLEREPLPEAHPAHTGGDPPVFWIYMSPPASIIALHLRLPSFFRGRARVGDSRRRMMVMEPCLRMSANHPAWSRRSTLQPPLSLRCNLKLSALPPHVAASLMRKFHSPAAAHRFHRDTPPIGLRETAQGRGS